MKNLFGQFDERLADILEGTILWQVQGLVMRFRRETEKEQVIRFISTS